MDRAIKKTKLNLEIEYEDHPLVISYEFGNDWDILCDVELEKGTVTGKVSDQTFLSKAPSDEEEIYIRLRVSRKEMSERLKKWISKTTSFTNAAPGGQRECKCPRCKW